MVYWCSLLLYNFCKMYKILLLLICNKIRLSSGKFTYSSHGKPSFKYKQVWEFADRIYTLEILQAFHKFVLSLD